MRYVSWGSVRGLGPIRDSEAEAEADVRRDGADCAKLGNGAYSDRRVYAIDDEGYLYREPYGVRLYAYPYGRSHGALRV